jgi:hypothetical protein
MSTFPSTIRFPASASFPTNATFPFGRLTLTNNQKLSLPANTPVGTRVRVTDGITIGGYNEIWVIDGTENEKPNYRRTQSLTTDVVKVDALFAGLLSGETFWNLLIDGNPVLAAALDTFVIQIPASIPVADTYATIQAGGGYDFGINFDDMPLADSYLHLDTISDQSLEIGVSDSPTAAQIASKIAQLTVFTVRSSLRATAVETTVVFTECNPTYLGQSLTDSGSGVTLLSDNTVFDSAATADLVATWYSIATGLDGGTVVTHPAVQQLVAPSTEQGGVFVSDGTQDGIYIIGDNYNGRPRLNLLGSALNGESQSITWNAFGFANKWTIFNADEGDPLYYSLSNVATPDLATNWKNASDDSPASITVTSVAQGKLDAGVQVTGAGTSSYNAPYSNRGISGSKAWFFYNKVGEATTDPDDVPPAHCIARDEDEWIINGVVGVSGYATEDDPNPYWFPFDDPVYVLQSGSAPAPTVTRNDVCSEANWINI